MIFFGPETFAKNTVMSRWTWNNFIVIISFLQCFFLLKLSSNFTDKTVTYNKHCPDKFEFINTIIIYILFTDCTLAYFLAINFISIDVFFASSSPITDVPCTSRYIAVSPRKFRRKPRRYSELVNIQVFIISIRPNKKHKKLAYRPRLQQEYIIHI